MGQIIAFFRAFMTDHGENEAFAQIYWDKAEKRFFAYVPKQSVCKEEVEADLHDCLYDDEERYLCYADIHSHNSMDAFFSGKDDQDERSTGLYLVLGKLDKFYPDVKARIFCGDSFVSIDPNIVMEGLEQPFPKEWLTQVSIRSRKSERFKKPDKRSFRDLLGGGVPMKFPTDRPVKVVMLGAGGTGGYVAPYVFRLLHMLDRPARFVVCDGDIVEPKNLDRQNFVPADLGENKARVLAERYSTVLGMETEYVPNFIEKLPDLMELIEPKEWELSPYSTKRTKEMVLLLGCVDNNKTRQLCHQAFHQSEELIYIDSGNGKYTGQVVCGVRRNGRTIRKSIGGVHPEMLKDTDLFPLGDQLRGSRTGRSAEYCGQCDCGDRCAHHGL